MVLNLDCLQKIILKYIYKKKMKTFEIEEFK